MKDANDIYDFNRLYHDYKKRFTHFAKTYVDDLAVAEDIVIDSLMYYWENRLSLENNANIPAYILTVIKNKCLNYLHRERIREEVEKYISDKEEWELNLRIATLEACDPKKLFSDEIQAIINSTLDSLSEQSRDIFIRSKYENQTNKEIARNLGLSIKSIEYHMTKTLKVLRVALKDYLPFLLMMFIDYN
ncbi:MAG: RNA polymerase sigma-70 factor [Tannerella sp.]|jgi:RNA polymerase sigma-70 factor (ECF subfamily)|nr:RNA polymerase sigma-70 factor [Tannerella sp.]